LQSNLAYYFRPIKQFVAVKRVAKRLGDHKRVLVLSRKKDESMNPRAE